DLLFIIPSPSGQGVALTYPSLLHASMIRKNVMISLGYILSIPRKKSIGIRTILTGTRAKPTIAPADDLRLKSGS
ncbi:MAG: hypothetical protein V3S39_10365, partial [Thermodesulfobacteriota bacterium]